MTTQAILTHRRANSAIVTLRRNGLVVTDFALDINDHGDVVCWTAFEALVEHHWLDEQLDDLREQIEEAL